nr:hypothetical protein [Streptomyces sp. SID3343]
MVSRAVRALPPGTLRVGIGVVVLGAASYVHLALAGHTLSPDSMANVSVLWTIAFSVGYGFYTPVEQEITRIVAARHIGGEGAAPVLRRGTILAGGILLAILLVVAAAGVPISDRLFGGQRSMLFALAGAFIGLAATAVTRGILAGLGLFREYGAQLAIDGGLRIVFAILLAVLGVESALMFSLILMVAPLLSVVVTLRPVLRHALPGATVTWKAMYRGLALLIVSTMLSQIVVNIAVINVKILEPGEVELVSALLSAIVLARVPLFVFTSLQTSLLPGLAGAHASGDHKMFRQLVLRSCGIVAALGLSGGLVATVLGPWLVPTLFGSPEVLGTADFAWFSAGTLCYMLALVLGQALMAQGAHRHQMWSWVVGVAGLVAVTASPGSIQVRVEVAYLTGSLGTALIMAVLLRTLGRRSSKLRADGAGAESGPGEAPLGVPLDSVAQARRA